MPTKVEKAEMKKKKEDKQAFFLQFIEEYRLREALWNPIIPEYHNKAVRSQLYAELLDFYQK